jgi:hypothetical protein
LISFYIIINFVMLAMLELKFNLITDYNSKLFYLII